MAYAFMSVFGLGVLWLCCCKPVVIALVVAIAAVAWVFGVFERRRFQKIAVERHEESICSFARSFDCRRVDTRIIRAVYEGLQEYLRSGHRRFPIRATDRIDKDLRSDREDLDDIAYDIAERAGYDMTNTKANPLFDKVKTVEDMVLFFTHQTRIS